jgi:hypothetical protein
VLSAARRTIGTAAKIVTHVVSGSSLAASALPAAPDGNIGWASRSMTPHVSPFPTLRQSDHWQAELHSFGYGGQPQNFIIPTSAEQPGSRHNFAIRGAAVVCEQQLSAPGAG